MSEPVAGATDESSVAATRSRLPGVARLAGLSDGVFAIVLTLLVLDLLPGDRPVSPEQLLEDWPAYLAYLTAFLTVGSIWLTHHAVFSRVVRVDVATLCGNLGILLGASLAPWPTALIAVALGAGDRSAEFAAIVLYGVVSTIVSVSIFVTTRHLSRHPGLLVSAAAARDLGGHHALRALAAVGVGAVAVLLALVSPLAALVLYLLVPIAFLVVTIVDGQRAVRGG